MRLFRLCSISATRMFRIHLNPNIVNCLLLGVAVAVVVVPFLGLAEVSRSIFSLEQRHFLLRPGAFLVFSYILGNPCITILAFLSFSAVFDRSQISRTFSSIFGVAVYSARVFRTFLSALRYMAFFVLLFFSIRFIFSRPDFFQQTAEQTACLFIVHVFSLQTVQFSRVWRLNNKHCSMLRPLFKELQPLI